MVCLVSSLTGPAANLLIGMTMGQLDDSLDVAGRFRPVVPTGESSSVGTANPVGPNGPVVAGSPIGPCETLSPLFHDTFGSGRDDTGSRSVRAFGYGPC